MLTIRDFYDLPDEVLTPEQYEAVSNLDIIWLLRKSRRIAQKELADELAEAIGVE